MRRFRNKQNRAAGPLPGHGGGWQIVYTGFVLILLSFFIMLTSFASLEKSKITRFARSFSNAVTVFSGGRSLEQGETMINGDALMVDKEDPMAQLFETVHDLSQKSGLENIDIRRSSKGVVMTLADKMLFESGAATLSESAYPILTRITAIIKKIKVPVEIEGHTDDLPIHTVAYPSNWELSTARAVNVLRYMTEKQQVEKHLLSAVGLSEYHPVVPNNSLENRNRNRRVEIIFKPGQE
ncbi:MAG: OmpA family protein [Desulfobacteraceae bacterium]|jgi:chemotaxis protein MotB